MEPRPADPRGAAVHARSTAAGAELIDHILVSHALVQRVVRADTTEQAPPSITEFPRRRRNAPGSDHRPVYAELDLG